MKNTLPFHPDRIEISNYTNEFEEQLINLSDSQFGEGYIKLDDLKALSQNSSISILVVVVEKQLLAFSIMEFTNSVDTASKLRLDPLWLRDKFPTVDLFCIRKQTAVKPNYAGNGIASKLLKKGLETGFSKADVVLSVIWNKPDSYSMDKILLKNGFTQDKEFEKYWHADSLENNYSCMQCGKPPCSCSASLFFLSK
ncbi:MAG: hypothetical protein HOA61_06300 [Bacteroidetes bacterium]|nr:hypothetical protein [Bacteroidota bacterium]MBT6835639.1 hypothetical protein [Bacteroidota bacterium]